NAFSTRTHAVLHGALHSTTVEQPTDTNALVGYINITLDVKELRMQWLRKTIPLWLLTLVLGILVLAFIFRKLLRSSKDITALATTCELVINNPDLEQLPVIQQRFEFRELMHIKQSFVLLFERLRELREQYAALGDLEQRLHQKDKSLETQRNNFQSMITHELKTSLNAISGGLQLLDSQHLSYDQQDTLAIISKGSQHLELTLEQIIQLNKIEKGQVTINLCEFNPLQMIADLLAKFDPIAQKKGLALISHTHHIDYTLEGDANKIQQVLTALIDNAIKFTHQGQITIESQLAHFNHSMRWQIRVIDTGIGIDHNYIEKIFMPFFQVDSSKTRQYEGAGIGLPIVKQMLQLLAASIEVDSRVGEGSQFTLIIPLRNKYKNWQHSPLEGLNIIYCHADDNDFLAKELKRLGAAVTFQPIEKLMMAQLVDARFDMMMFAEDILPEQVAQLAQLVRDYETKHRTLLIYWHPMNQANERYKFEHELKIAGIDYYHSVPEHPETLVELLKKWMGED
ncbi:MAG: HAMP domain-containing histidine kinase, partial [Psychrobacter sp.]|nr:HAMP domain-containing histidine kinase [Psychrobacter sp.]